MPITIGIPFFNAENYLADAIRSVFAQTYQDWELLLLDDGSTDHSLDIALSVKDSRVRVISDGQNRRLPFRLNQITQESKYDLIGRMDADDLISPTRIEKQIGILNNNLNYDLVTTGICSISNDNKPIGMRCAPRDSIVTGRKLLLGQTGVVHAAIVGRKSWFLRNPYDNTANRTEDYELWLRAYSKKDFKICFVGEPLYYYREGENVTANRILTAYAGLPNLFNKYGYLGFNRFEMSYQLKKIYIKSTIVQMLSAINRMDALLKKRNNIINDENIKNVFLQEIQQILGTKVPGLN
jgi:glycosyltransferase involved in cell wall biosynthesis